MIGKVFYSLIAASVVAATAIGGSQVLRNVIPQGRVQENVERWMIAPGQALHRRFNKTQAADNLKGKKKNLDAAGQRLKDKLQDSAWGRSVLETASKSEDEANRLMHLYNIGIWSAIGFALCLIMTIIFSVSSLASAVSLGLKVTITLVFLQGALIFAGILAIPKP